MVSRAIKRLKTLEELGEDLSKMRETFDELDMLFYSPEDIPDHVHRTDNQDKVGIYVHNIIGWLTGIVWKEAGKIRERHQSKQEEIERAYDERDG